MGNRAVITTSPYKASNIGIYVHWNGGRASIEGFLKAARDLEYRTPATDPSYAMAGLAGLIWSYLGTDGLSVGLGTCDQLVCDNGDNGTWLIGDDWSLVANQSTGFYDRKVNTKFIGEMSALTKAEEDSRDAIAATIVAKVKAANAAHAPEVDA